MTRDEILAIIKQAEEEGWEELDLSGQGLTELPEEIGRLVQLKVLNLGSGLNPINYALRFNYLSTLPDTIAELTNLQTLIIDRNEFNSFPRIIAKLGNLQSLDISFNQIGDQSDWQTKLAKLQFLNISGNNLFALPKWVFNLTNLQSIDISLNKLSSLPDWIIYLTNIQSLELSDNHFINLPDSLANLTNLLRLGISGNGLESIPRWLSRLVNLRKLFINDNKLVELPDSLAELSSLESLGIGDNYIKSLPKSLKKLGSLQALYIQNLGCPLPVWIGNMSHLKSLDIGFNDLAAFPEWLANLTNLQKLYTRKNNLTTLPKWLLKLTKIQSLDLSVNHLKTLPEWLDQLPNLKKLDLSSNKLETLPKPLTQLSNLESLRLSENNLRTLPASLVNLPKLVDLRIANNPIVEPSPEVLGAAITNYRAVDLEALRRYYAQLREEGEEIFYEAKLLIIGEGGAGKTSLARKLREPDIPLDLKEESTKGIEVVEWGFELPEGYEQEKYRVNIWDFGGQEIYFATHQFFLTKRSVYVLVADTRRQHTDFYNWLRMQETFGAESAIVLLKNRNREHGSRFSIENLPELQKRFPNLQEVIELDLSNVPQEEEWPWLLQRLKSHFLKLEHVGQPRPSTWVRVRQALNEDERDTVSREEFLALCYEQGVKREADALQLSDYLHHLGDILHFQDDPVLGDIVILKPTWGLDAVYRVLDNVTIVDNWGRFTLHDLRRLWHKDHYNGHHHQLLRLMQNFQLCYPLYDMPDTFIAPQLLREDVPEYEWDGENNLQLRYHYPVFMPRGILSRAIVKLNNHIEEQRLVWRSGVILKDKYARAEVLELRVNYEIRIRISGRNKGNLMMEIVRALDELHQGFPKLQYHKLIPCNCLTCRPLADPNFFPLELLLDAKARGERNIQCYKSFKQVNIRSLLDEGYQSLARLQEREGMVQ